MKYLLTYVDEMHWTDMGGVGGVSPLPEEDLDLFDTEEDLVAYIIPGLTFSKESFSSPYFDVKFTAEDCCKPPRDKWVRKTVVRKLLKTLEDLKNLTPDIQVETTYKWYEVEDDYILEGRLHMSDGLYNALYDPTTGYSYMSTIGHVPGYRD